MHNSSSSDVEGRSIAERECYAISGVYVVNYTRVAFSSVHGNNVWGDSCTGRIFV